MGLKLALVIWNKLGPVERSAVESHLVKTTLDLIDAGQYRPAINVMEFSLSSPIKFSEHRMRLICTINLAQAHKWNGDESRCHEILNIEDWSAASPEFSLAIAVLQDRYQDASKVMERMSSTGNITKRDFDEWPLFCKFRESKEFCVPTPKYFQLKPKLDKSQQRQCRM